MGTTKDDDDDDDKEKEDDDDEGVPPGESDAAAPRVATRRGLVRRIAVGVPNDATATETAEEKTKKAAVAVRRVVVR